MRKNSILFVFLLLLGLAAATPYLAGYQFKKNFLEVVNAFAPNKNFKVEVVEYKQGWLSSDTKIQITMQLPPGDATTETPDKNSALVETIESHIMHGPLIRDPDSKQFTLAMADIQSKIYLKGLDFTTTSEDSSLARISTLVDFKNHWNSQVTQPAASISLSNIGKFSSQGSTGSIDFNIRQGLISELNIVSESKGIFFTPFSTDVILEVNIDSLNYETHSAQNTPGEWTGDTTVHLSTLNIKKADSSTIVVQDGKLSHSTKNPDPKLLGFDVNLSVKNIQTANDLLPTLGPIQLTFAVNNLNSEGLQALSSFLKTVHGKPLSREDRETYMNLLPKVVTPSTSILEKMTASTALGDLQNDAAVSWKLDSTSDLTMQTLMANINATLNAKAAVTLVDKLIAARDEEAAKTAATAAATAPVPDPALVAQTASKKTAPPTGPATATTPTLPPESPPTLRQTFDAWIQQGYIAKEGDNYVLSFKHEGGSTTINGKTMPQ